MYAVVTTGNRQYRVSPGDKIDVEKLTGAVGDTVALTHVQLVGQGAEVTIGAPVVAGARVEAQIVAQKRGKKIIIFKHRRRKGYRRKQGHRQSLTALQITGIYTVEQSAPTLEQSEPAPEQGEAVLEQSIPLPEQSEPSPLIPEGLV
jgi:large subunit ribosomal protein L21